MKTIYIDIDDTIRQTSKQLLKFANKNSDKLLSKKYPVSFKSGYTYIQYYDTYMKDFLLQSKPVIFSRLFCKLLNMFGYRIIFLSCQPYQLGKDISINWLRKYKFVNHKKMFNDYDNTNIYQFVDTMNDKCEIMRKQNNKDTILLDDFAYFNPDIKKYCKFVLIKNMWHKHNYINKSVRLSPILLIKILMNKLKGSCDVN